MGSIGGEGDGMWTLALCLESDQTALQSHYLSCDSKSLHKLWDFIFNLEDSKKKSLNWYT